MIYMSRRRESAAIINKRNFIFKLLNYSAFVKHDLKENVEMFKGRNLHPPPLNRTLSYLSLFLINKSQVKDLLNKKRNKNLFHKLTLETYLSMDYLLF